MCSQSVFVALLRCPVSFLRVYDAFEVAPVQLYCVQGTCCSKRSKMWDLRIKERLF